MSVAAQGRGVLELLPWVLQKVSPTVSEDLQLVSAGILMTFRQIDFLPVVNGMSVVGGFAGLHVVSTLEKVRDGGIWRLVARKVGEVCDRSVPHIGPRDSLLSVLSSMNDAKFGHGCVLENNGELVATIAFRDIIRYLSGIDVKAGIQVKEIASAAVSLPREATITELLNTLLTKRIRRVIVRGSEKQVIADDKILARQAFSHEGLLAMRYTAKVFFERQLSSLALAEPGSVKGDQDVAEAWSLMYRNPAECLLVEGENKIVTPWDAVLKPYTLGKFPSISARS
jgi:CBS domain-containing protein